MGHSSRGRSHGFRIFFFFGGGGGGVKIIMHIYNPLKSYVHVTTYLLRTQLESIFPEGNMGTYMFKMLRS